MTPRSSESGTDAAAATCNSPRRLTHDTHTHTHPALLALISLTAAAAAASGQSPPIDRTALLDADLVIHMPNESGFGNQVASLGDINGDGFEDILVSAPSAESNPAGGGARGKAWVFFGPLGTTDPSFIYQGEGQSDAFGQSIDGSGDFNGDGVRDILIGAPSFGADKRGRTYVYSGSDGSLLATWTGSGADIRMGTRVRFFVNVDDFTGDEVLNTQVSATGGFSRTHVQSSDPSVMTSLFMFDDPPFVARAGNVNAPFDGDDIAIGFFTDATNGAAAGRIRYRRGNSGALIPSPDGPFGDPGERLGNEIVFMGDIDGDGFGDVAASGFHFDSQRGRVRIVSGKGPDHQTIRVMEGTGPTEHFGFALANAGDVNGDGVNDVAIGSDRFDGEPFMDPNDDYGRAYIYSGATGAMLARFTGEPASGGVFGRAVATADYNGDGVPDMVVGSPGVRNVYVFFMPQPCPGDLNNDGVVDGVDLLLLLNAFGECPASPPAGPCLADLNGTGVVDGVDLIILLNAFGACPPPLEGATQESLLGAGAQALQAEAVASAGFFLEFGFADMDSYTAWLGTLDAAALVQHIQDLLGLLQSKSE